MPSCIPTISALSACTIRNTDEVREALRRGGHPSIMTTLVSIIAALEPRRQRLLMITDRFVIEFDKALRTLFAPASDHSRGAGEQGAEAELSDRERAHAGALMRINHVGEVCAQALYQGQALSCDDQTLRQALARKLQTRKPSIWRGPSAVWLSSENGRAC
jgi:hypothetical protein